MGQPSFEWTPAIIATLRAGWAEGRSARDIAGEIGVTKNAVVGKAHREGLAGRPSPIRRDGPPPERRPAVRKVAPKVTLSAPQPAPMPVPAPPAPVRTGPVRACCYPLGEPRTANFRFCADPTLPGSVYCAPHHAVCRRPVSGGRLGMSYAA